MAAGLAGAVFGRAVKAFENGMELVFDIGQMKEFFIDFDVAALAEPQQPVLFVRQALAFDHQAVPCEPPRVVYIFDFEEIGLLDALDDIVYLSLQTPLYTVS